MAQVVIDANIGIALVVNMARSSLAAQAVTRWRENNVTIAIPGLWWYEVVSVLRKMVVAKTLSENDAVEALDDLSGLHFSVVETTLDLHRSALRWAHRLKQAAAYDAQYLALAEKLGAQFWTSDQRLANNTKQHSIDWVQLLGSLS